MSVLSNYFTTRYINRMEELINDVQDRKQSSESDYSFYEFLKNKLDQFHTTSKMHIRGFERQDVPAEDVDIKYLAYIDTRWIISLLCGDVSTDEIKKA